MRLGVTAPPAVDARPDRRDTPPMDLDAALAAEQAIADTQCDALLRGLDAALDGDALTRAINAVVGPVTDRQKATRDLLRDFAAQAPTTPPAPLPARPWESGRPASMRTLWADDFDGPLDTSTWLVYGPDNGRDTWGQTRGGKAVCTGFYAPSQVQVRDSALVIVQQRDPKGRTVHGRPAWLTGFVSTTGRKAWPVDCFIEAEVEFDTSAKGNWWAPWWTGLWGSSDNEERDCEWFGDYPRHIGFAYHVNEDGSPGLVTNVDSRVLGRRNNAPVPDGNPGARHRYGWWTRPCPDHAGHRRHSRYIDGKVAMELCTWETAQKGVRVDEVLRRPAGTNEGVSIRICGQAENLPLGLTYTAEQRGPYEMKVHWIAVSAPA